MLDLVLWTWLLALAPWALGLARKVISGVAGRIGPACPTVRSPFPGGQPPQDLLPDPAGDRSEILMRSNTNLIAMLASSLLCRGRERRVPAAGWPGPWIAFAQSQRLLDGERVPVVVIQYGRS